MEDTKLLSAKSGQSDPDDDRLIEEARAKAKAADQEFGNAVVELAKVSALGGALFFGP